MRIPNSPFLTFMVWLIVIYIILERYDFPETLFYLDPPYPHSTRMDKKVYRHEMTDDDHRELAKVVRQLKGMVIISGYPCDLYDQELYLDWRRVKCRTYADLVRYHPLYKELVERVKTNAANGEAEQA